jgi:hypothetical protein
VAAEPRVTMPPIDPWYTWTDLSCPVCDRGQLMRCRTCRHPCCPLSIADGPFYPPGPDFYVDADGTVYINHVFSEIECTYLPVCVC